MNSFPKYQTTPVYPDANLYSVLGPLVRAWEFNGWKPESLSWKTSAYIHAGLSASGTFRYTGAGALDFLQSIVVNSLAKFPVGTAKHAIMCTEQGLIAGHGVLKRSGEDDFTLFVAGMWSSYMHKKTPYDVKEEYQDDFLFQIAGPNSLEILEAVTGEDLHDLGFLRFRQTSAAGHPVEVMRVGMAGTLGYELHGPMNLAAEVYDAVYRAGAPYGLERLGWRTYTVNHVEGGFPQNIWTFFGAGVLDEGMAAYLEQLGMAALGQPVVSGSVDPDDLRARFRTPYEVGWGGMVKFDHDFVGRSALETEAIERPRSIVTLEWNSEDVIDIFASHYREGPEYKYMDLPTAPHLHAPMAHADQVQKDGRDVGWSSGTIYSYFFRKTISHATIDASEAHIGNELTVDWGDFGGTIKKVRAVVARYPYLSESRNQDIDTSLIPSGVRKAESILLP